MKHGLKLSLTNLFGDDFGNAAVPAKLAGATTRRKATGSFRIGLSIAAVLFLVAGIIFFRLDRARISQGSRSAEAPPKSIAVLPFDNLSRDPENAYFSEGIQDEILTRLAKTAELKVISRTSTQRFKSSPDDLPRIAAAVGRRKHSRGQRAKTERPGAGQCAVDPCCNRHASVGRNLRSQIDRCFCRGERDAKAIAERLKAKLTETAEHVLASRPTENPEAHQLYMKGRYFWNKRTTENLKKAIDYFEQAIGKDPAYALAYSGLADVHAVLPYYAATPPKDDAQRALAAARKAVELDPQPGRSTHLPRQRIGVEPAVLGVIAGVSAGD